jgi:Holliday junction resolvase
MGRKSRDKGARTERQVVALHRKLGIRAERVPLSGATRYQGNGADVDIYAFGPNQAPLATEVKSRGGGAGFKTLERWLGENDALFLRRDRSEPVVVLPWRTWQRLIAGAARVKSALPDAGRSGEGPDV